jgi:hypothetical protein
LKVLNYPEIARRVSKRVGKERNANVGFHKINERAKSPTVSIILLDWECRERFHSPDWLNRQDLPREEYELIWVELYNRVVPQVLEKVDVLVTCGQAGLYHKHVGYNIGLLHARGEIITVCDSDAVFPRDFVSSILRAFKIEGVHKPASICLMHHELRTSYLYPDDLKDSDELKCEKWRWWPINPNVGACVSIRRKDAIRFGGFDEHKSYKGYLCGPYDLAWRMINAGIPEIWHDTSTVLWHFAHPDPAGVNGLVPTIKMLLEYSHPHVDLHALTAVEAFSTGRLLPLKENPEIFRLRLEQRKIGSKFEKKYACLTGPNGFSRLQVLRLKCSLAIDLVSTAVARNTNSGIRRSLQRCLPRSIYDRLRNFRRWLRRDRGDSLDSPRVLGSYRGHNMVSYGGMIYVLPQSLGYVDFALDEHLSHPEIFSVRTRTEAWRLIAGRTLTRDLASPIRWCLRRCLPPGAYGRLRDFWRRLKGRTGDASQT